ncbi:hypothetical protein D3C85_1930900 [compost metagenome]
MIFFRVAPNQPKWSINTLLPTCPDRMAIMVIAMPICGVARVSTTTYIGPRNPPINCQRGN